MKAIIIVLAISFVTVLAELTDEQKAKFKEYKELCINESGVDPTVVENAKKGEIPENDEKLACFGTCILKKSGILNKNEEIDLEVFRAKMSNDTHADYIYNACKDTTGTGCAKGGNLIKCIWENKKNLAKKGDQ